MISHPSALHAFVVIMVVVVVGGLSRWSESSHIYAKPFLRKVKSMVEQATRWHVMARQDTNPLLQLIHSNNALAYAHAVRSIASEQDIEKITGIDINELIYFLEECQSVTVKNVGQQCPNMRIDGSYAVASGWT